MIQSPPATRVALLAALAGAVVCALGAVTQPMAFWPTWTTATVFWVGAAIGCLAIGLLHPLSGGNWGWGMGRELHAGLGVMPVMGLALLVLGLGAPHVYPWAQESAHETLNPNQFRFLAPQYVLLRTVVSWVLWSGMAYWLVRNFFLGAPRGLFMASARLAAFGMIALWLTASFAAIDGIMAITPGWSSSLFGMLQIVGFAGTGMSLLIIMRYAVKRDTLTDPEQTGVTHDLGNLLLAFTMVWSYLAFSQYLIIWSGDLPQEVSWYVDRRTSGWKAVAIALILFHFVAPLALLVSRDVKRHPKRLALVAGLILAMQLVDHVWTILPSFHETGVMSFVYLAASWVTLGGLWWNAVGRLWKRLPEVNLAVAFADDPLEAAQPEKVT